MKRRRRNVELITDARRSPIEDWQRRRRIYAVLQGSRIPFLLAAIGVYTLWHNLWIFGILVAISVPLPWIAVVIANAVGEPQDGRQQRVYKPGVAREQQRQAAEQSQLSAASSRQLNPVVISGDPADESSDSDGVSGGSPEADNAPDDVSAADTSDFDDDTKG